MHEPFIVHAIHHLLILLVVSFFILFAASKADGIVKLFGNILGVIILVLAILSVAFGVMHPPMHDEDGKGGWMMGHMHGGWAPWMHPGAPAAPNMAPPAAAPAPAAPAAPKKP